MSSSILETANNTNKHNILRILQKILEDMTNTRSILETVNVREKCTILSLKNNSLFDASLFDPTHIISSTEINDININDTLGRSTKYEICSLENNIAYENCALKYKNPYLTSQYNSITSNYACAFPDKAVIKGDKKFVFNYDTNSNIIKPDAGVYFKNTKQSYCEERWHDWFCIPNYLFDNRWAIENPSSLENTKSVGKCLMPCSIGYVPSVENMHSCIMKKDYLGGIYSTDFDYTPLALICLFGTTFDSFKDENFGYVSLIKKKLTENDPNYELIMNQAGDQNIIENILPNINKDDNVIWVDVKKDIKKYINDLIINTDLNDNFIARYIVIPSENVKNLMKAKLSPDNILYAYNIAKKIQLCQRPENNKAYIEFRYKLSLIADLQEQNFVRLLKVLKKCCNLCFDGTTDFSKNYILMNINPKDTSTTAITLDIEYDIEVEKYEMNDFKISKQPQTLLFEEYTTSYNSMIYYANYVLTIIILIIICFLIKIFYMNQYSLIRSIMNMIIRFFVYLRIDITEFIKSKFKKYRANQSAYLKANYENNIAEKLIQSHRV